MFESKNKEPRESKSGPLFARYAETIFKQDALVLKRIMFVEKENRRKGGVLVWNELNPEERNALWRVTLLANSELLSDEEIGFLSKVVPSSVPSENPEAPEEEKLREEFLRAFDGMGYLPKEDHAKVYIERLKQGNRKKN